MSMTAASYSAGSTGCGRHVICIDPGHQAHGDASTEPNGPGSSTMKARVSSGTRGTTTGVYEYILNLDISLQLKKELESRGYQVVMTRETHDINISNKERAEMATSAKSDVVVRIHANGSQSSSDHGALALVPSVSNLYVSHLAEDSNRLALKVLDDYCRATGMVNLGIQKNDTMTGINWCTVPVMILEMGFMTNPTDDVNMQKTDYQFNMVKGIANGIDAFFSDHR